MGCNLQSLLPDGGPGTETDAGELSGDSGVVPDAGVGDSGIPDAGPATPVAPLAVEGVFPKALMRAYNNFVVTVKDANGVPWKGATVNVSLWMPAHGHGAPAPSMTDQGDGTYTGSVTFSMAGSWDVTVKAKLGTLTAQTVMTGVKVP